MLQKSRARGGFLGTALAVATVAEVVAFCGCYYYYRRLNSSQEYRYWMYQNFRPGLEAYYKTGAMFGDNAVRTYDYKTWGIEE
ncbi:protein CEBPZOS-like isoform X2 [Dermacentor andersoni]|uniref:protein CEBPZOS-like isoform X2 n=1 Tax=Dermacentor andersoni TaxID=34620 RepID=UPI0024161395|nr:protein CEBPZOS-like isoform X2 [Dermacentor andersoni]